MAIGLRFDKGASAGTANQSREDFAIGEVCTIVATGIVGTATFQILAPPPGSTAALVPIDPLSQSITIDVQGRWDIRVGDTANGSRIEHTFAAPTARKGLIAPAHSEKASPDANAVDVDPGTWTDESHSNVGGRFTGYAPDIQKMVAVLEDEGAETGWLAGGDITVNGPDPAKYDIAQVDIFVKGLGALRFPAQIGITPSNLATTVFTVPMMGASGLVQLDIRPTATQHKALVQLQTVQHIDLATVTGIDNTRSLAEAVPALMDYARSGGIINTGNNFIRSTGFTIDKTAGVTTEFLLNGTNPLAPNDPVNAELITVLFPSVIRNGSGGHTFLFPNNDVPVGFWDNNSGSLVATIKYVIYQMRFFNDQTGCFVGQRTYDTLDEAAAAVFIDALDLPPPILTVGNNFRTAIIARGDASDWTDPAEVKFIQVSPSFPGGMEEGF